MSDRGQGTRPGERALVWGGGSVVLGFLLFALSALIGAAQGHAFSPVALLFIPLALVIGGLSALTVGGVQRLMN